MNTLWVCVPLGLYLTIGGIWFCRGKSWEPFHYGASFGLGLASLVFGAVSILLWPGVPAPQGLHGGASHSVVDSMPTSSNLTVLEKSAVASVATGTCRTIIVSSSLVTVEYLSADGHVVCSKTLPLDGFIYGPCGCPEVGK